MKVCLRFTFKVAEGDLVLERTIKMPFAPQKGQPILFGDADIVLVVADGGFWDAEKEELFTPVEEAGVNTEAPDIETALFFTEHGWKLIEEDSTLEAVKAFYEAENNADDN